MTEREQKTLLVTAADGRQVAIVVLYQTLLWSMFLSPALRSSLWLIPTWIAACALSFLNAVVIHNHLHRGIFRNRTLNRAFRVVLSFGNLYPASANIASHNLIHHQFDDDGQPDWAAPSYAPFRWQLLNLIHFPNVIGPNTFSGVTRWSQTTRQADFRRQYLIEQVAAFGLTGVLLVCDVWAALFCVVLPQLWGARGILRINLLQHDACDIESEWNHSRNFTGRILNWWMCNNGFHTIHHNRAALHWSVLREAHDQGAVPKMHVSLNERSMFTYLWRTYVLGTNRAAITPSSAARQELLSTRDEMRHNAELASLAD